MKKNKRTERRKIPQKLIKFKMGPSTKLSRELIEEISNLLKSGAYVVTVCDAKGIDEKSFYNWINRAEAILSKLEMNQEIEVSEYDQLCVELFQSVRKVQSEAELFSLAKVRTGSDGWQGNAWYLERKFHQRWRRRDFIQSENTNTNLNIESGKYSMDELMEVLDVDTKRKILDAMGFLDAKKVEAHPTPKLITNG